MSGLDGPVRLGDDEVAPLYDQLLDEGFPNPFPGDDSAAQPSDDIAVGPTS